LIIEFLYYHFLYQVAENIMKKIIIIGLYALAFCSCSRNINNTIEDPLPQDWWPKILREGASHYGYTDEYHQSVIDIIDSTYSIISDSTVSTTNLEPYVCRMNAAIEYAILNDTSLMFTHMMRATARNFGGTIFPYDLERIGSIECALSLTVTTPYLWQTSSNETGDLMALSLCENSYSSMARNAFVLLYKSDLYTGHYGNYAAILLSDGIDTSIVSFVIHLYDEEGASLDGTLGYGGVDASVTDENIVQLFFTLDDFLDALSKSETMTITYQTASGEVSMTALHGQTFRKQIKDCPRLAAIVKQ
jgi:hypothetical protein